MIRTGTSTGERPCEDRDRRQASTDQGGSPQEKNKPADNLIDLLICECDPEQIL